MMERLNKARHFNLFFTFVNYGCRKFNNSCPGAKWLNIEKIYYIFGCYSVMVLPSYIRLGWKWQGTVRNTVAYYTIILLTAVKKLPLPMP